MAHIVVTFCEKSRNFLEQTCLGIRSFVYEFDYDSTFV